MSGTVIGFLGAVGGVLVVLVGGLFRNSRKSPESQTALNDGWKGLTGGLQASLDSLRRADEDKTRRLNEQDSRITLLESELRTVKALNQWLSQRVLQLIEFIRGHDLEPPPEDPKP